MKKCLLFSVAVMMVFGIYAQDKASYLIDLNFGGRLLKMKTSAGSGYDCAAADLGGSIGITYMFCNITDEDLLSSLGVKLDLGYDRINSTYLDSEITTQSNLFRVSGQGVIDLDDLFGLNMAPFGLLAHGGAGISYLSNKESSAVRTDRIMNFIAGVSPRYWINENMAITMDVSFIALDRMNNGVEMIKLGSNQAPIAKYVNATIGFTYGINDTK
ncbi:MAG TPA: hypothetical protein PLL66_01055 [Bacteroidales bacterium]|nr:hypothetical protein [Bacteroidales bacterium]